MGNRTARRCLKCSRRTEAKSGLCIDHRPANTPSDRPFFHCRECGAVTRSKWQLCRTHKAEAEYLTLPGEDDDALMGGQWITVRGIQRWQSSKDGAIADSHARMTESVVARRSRISALLAERYAENGWWKRSGLLFDDAPGAKTEARLADLVADFDRIDMRLDSGKVA